MLPRHDGFHDYFSAMPLMLMLYGCRAFMSGVCFIIAAYAAALRYAIYAICAAAGIDMPLRCHAMLMPLLLFRHAATLHADATLMLPFFAMLPLPLIMLI